MAARSRAAAALLLALLLSPLGTGVAAAHGGTEGPAARSLPRVVAVEPAVAGLDVVVVEGGARLRIDNRTDRPVTVLPAGVPVIAPGGSAAWSDPRLGDPAAAPADTAAHWAVPLVVGEVPVTVRGDRVWPAPPHPFPWWALTVAALLGTYTVGGLAVERSRRSGYAVAAAGIALLVVTAYAVHVLGSALVLAQPLSPAVLLAAAGIGTVCCLLGLVAAVLTLRGHPLGLVLAGPTGFLAALLTVFDTAAFHQPVLAFGWSFDLDRLTTVVTVGGGAGLFLVALGALRRAEATAAAPARTAAGPTPDDRPDAAVRPG